MNSTEKLLHDMAAALESGYNSYSPKDHWCIEIVEKDARRLLARYERWRVKQKSAGGGGEKRRTKSRACSPSDPNSATPRERASEAN